MRQSAFDVAIRQVNDMAVNLAAAPAIECLQI